MKKLLFLLLITTTLLADTWYHVAVSNLARPFYRPEMFWNAVTCTNADAVPATLAAPFYDQTLAMNAVAVTNGSGEWAMAIRLVDSSGATSSNLYLKKDNDTAGKLSVSNLYIINKGTIKNTYTPDFNDQMYNPFIESHAYHTNIWLKTEGGVGIYSYTPYGYTFYGTSPGDDECIYGYSGHNKGIHGKADDNYGVYGEAHYRGTYGEASYDYGVYGVAGENYGVYGRARNVGVHGYATYDQGVRGSCGGSWSIYAQTAGVVSNTFRCDGGSQFDGDMRLNYHKIRYVDAGVMPNDVVNLSQLQAVTNGLSTKLKSIVNTTNYSYFAAYSDYTIIAIPTNNNIYVYLQNAETNGMVLNIGTDSIDNGYQLNIQSDMPFCGMGKTGQNNETNFMMDTAFDSITIQCDTNKPCWRVL